MRSKLRIAKNALTVALGSVLVVVAARAAEPRLDEKTAQTMVERFFGNNCGVVLPKGEYNFPITDAAQGGSKYDFTQNLIALKKIDAIKWIDMQSMLGFAHFRVEPNDNLDSNELIALGSSLKCIKFSSEPQTTKVIKVEPVIGGVTRWTGAIVYAVLTANFTPLYQRYVQEKKINATPVRRARIVFRFDPFKEEWRILIKPGQAAWDIGPINGDFNSQNVPQVLRGGLGILSKHKNERSTPPPSSHCHPSQTAARCNRSPSA